MSETKVEGLTEGKYHFLLVPESGEDIVPKWETASSLEELFPRLHEALLEHMTGYIYLVFDGKRALLSSSPRQVFDLQLPDGKVVQVESKPKVTFSQDGHFTALALPT